VVGLASYDEKQKVSEKWTPAGLAVLLFWIVGFVVTGVIAVSMTYRGGPSPCLGEPSWESYTLTAWVFGWCIAWLVLVTAVAVHQGYRSSKSKQELRP